MIQNLSDVSYYRTGGVCQHWFEPKTLEELTEAMTQLKGMPWFLLGAGSNSLVMDEEWKGGVLTLRSLKKLERTPHGFIVGAGYENTQFSERAYENSLTGAEFLNGLPGQIGGTVRMNARCYGGEISQIVKRVWTVDSQSQLKVWDRPQECFRGYKDTIFMEQPLVVAQVEVELVTTTCRENSRKKMDFCSQDRQKKGQYKHPSCGCVFKNNYDPDVAVPSGMLLEAVHVKGLRNGQAVVSDLHANFVYNQDGQASSREILELTLLMREKVWERFGVWLDYEMEILGTIPEDLVNRIQERRMPQYQEERLQMIRKQFANRRTPTPI